jgi:putative redox protein
MKARVQWVEASLMVAEASSGHAVVLDGPPEAGGRNLGVRAMEMVLMGLGGCTAVDVITILKKARQPVIDCVVELEAERASQPPKVFTKIHIHYIVTGKGLQEGHVKRAITLSAQKYCSVSAMLAKTAELTHDYEIREAP